MRKLLFAALFPIAISSCGDSQSAQQSGEKKDSTAVIPAAENTRIEILDAEALNFIDTTAKVENLAGGYEWSEGPLYIADGDYVLFSDVPKNRIYKWKEGEGASLYLDSSGYVGPNVPKREPGSNGLLLDKEGRLVLCQHGFRRVARMEAPLNAPKPVYAPLADKFQGKRLNSPNDAVFHSNGDLYFTDPPYGLDGGTDDPAKEQPHHGVYRAKPNGQVDLITKEFEYPNGIALTPDEKYLIVAHSDGNNMVWMKYELDINGLAKNKSVFYKISEEEKKLPGSPDGFKINKQGYVFASGPGGVWVFNAGGKPVAKIYTGQATSNCGLSADQRTLYMTCDAFLYRLKLK
jgi:gluconolactonase